MALKDDILLFSRLSIFQGLSEEHLRLLAFGAERRRLEKGHVLFRQGAAADSAFVVTRGHLKLTMHAPRGGEKLVDVLTGAERVGYWNVAAAARIAKGAEMPIDLFMPTYFVMSDDTAAMLKEKGLEVDYITPEEAVQVGQDYSNELGPDQPDERISGAK